MEASKGETAEPGREIQASKDSRIPICCSTCNRTGVTNVAQNKSAFFYFTRKVHMATEKKNKNAGLLTFFTEF